MAYRGARSLTRVGLAAGLLAALLVGSAAAGALAEPVGERWRPAPGQAFNDGWKPLGQAATYLPCQTVRWSFDRAGEHPERNTMIDDVRTALSQLQPLSGLTFTEVAAGTPAELTFRWGDLASEGHGGAAAYGGFKGFSQGFVVFDRTVDWTKNTWSGWDWRRLEWPRPDLGPGWYSWNEGPGRVALVIHEVMHAMGFGHVEDFTSIMYPQGDIPNNQGRFSPGDIAGLKAMYLDRPCTLDSATLGNGPTLTRPSASSASTVTLTRIAKGSRVMRSSIDQDGGVSATLKTRLPQGSRVTVRLIGPVNELRSYTRRVQPGGLVAVSERVTPEGRLEVRDQKGRLIARWASGA